MLADSLFEIAIDELLASPAGQKLGRAMETVAAVQHGFYALKNSDDDTSTKLLRIGTVFQLFLVDTLLAGRKRPSELSSEDWKSIANKVAKYAILSDGQSYSVFVFTLYADYIDLSVACLRNRIPEESREAMESSMSSIQELSNTIRNNADCLQDKSMTETAYVESCLWLSLEGMIKLLSASLVTMIGPEYTQLVQAVSQLAFEYGRYVLFAKEQALLEAYLQNQRVLDDQLKREYDEFLAELRENADRFMEVIDAAFSPNLHDALEQSVFLARSAGVKDEDLLSTMDDIDRYFSE